MTADEGEALAACALCHRPLQGLVLMAERFVLAREPVNREEGLTVVLDARAHAECAIDSNRDGWIIDLSPEAPR